MNKKSLDRELKIKDTKYNEPYINAIFGYVRSCSVNEMKFEDLLKF